MVQDRSPRSLTHQIETSAVPLKVLEAIRELRTYLDRVESERLCDARDAGASIADIAQALGTTRQTVYNKLKALAETRQGTQPAAPETVVIPDLDSERDA